MLESLTDIQRQMNSGHRIVNPEGSRSGARRRKMSSSGSSDSKGSTGGSIYSSHMNNRKRRYLNISLDEFKKEMPPTFDGEIKTGQEVEAWIFGMKKYFLGSILLEEYEGQSSHLQPEWKSFYFVGKPQAGEEA